MKLGIQDVMNTQQTTNGLQIAVPYYGSLSLPPLGLSRLFFVASLDVESGRVGRIGIEVWDPKKEPNLAAWMRTQGISGVICSDSGSHYQAALNSQSIWLVGDQDGEAAELVERWAAGALDKQESRPLGEQFKRWCGLEPECGVLAV